MPDGTYYLVLKNTEPGNAESYTNCEGADGFGTIRYRVLNTRDENFWDTNFTEVASVGKDFVPSSPAGTVACNCRCSNDIRFHKFFETRLGTALNLQAFTQPTLDDGETEEAGYKSTTRNAYMHFQSFTYDVDSDVSTDAQLQVILRDDDDANDVEPFAGDDAQRLAQRRTLIHAQTYEEWAGSAGGTIGSALRSAKTDGDGVVEDTRTAGSLTHGLPLGIRDGAWGTYDHNYVPGFHFESTENVVPGNRYVVSVFRTCSNGAGHCDETSRDDSAKSFQFKITAQVIVRSSFQWQLVESRDTNVGLTKERDDHKRGFGTSVVTVADRYVCMLGGPMDDGGTGSPFAIYDTENDVTYNPSGFGNDRMAWAVAVEDKGFVPSGNLVGAFVFTHGYHHASSNSQRALQPYAVRKVTISHRAGQDPTIAVTEIYGEIAVPDMPARFGSAGVWYDDKILVHGGFHIDGDHELVATSCVRNPSDSVWAFDMNNPGWSLFAGPTRPNADGTFCASDPGLGRGRHAAAVLNADRTASSVDGSLPPDPTLRISGGYSKISGGSTEMTGDPSDISSDQWSLNLVTKVWTKLSTPEYSEADARDMATTRADHALIVLGESMTVMTGGQCRTLERCKENFILAQPLGPDPRSELLTNVTLGVHPVTYMHNSNSDSKMVNKAVMAGAHVYVFSFGDYDSFQGFGDSPAVGYIWKYKLVAHVKNAAPAVDSNDAARGSQAMPYRTLSYAVNRGQAPVVVLMTGSHEGVGNAEAVIAGPSMGKAPVNDGNGSPCHLAVATTLPFSVTPSDNSALDSAGRLKRKTCVAPLIIAGQNNAILDGTRVSNDAGDTNAVAAALTPIEKCQQKCAELEHCCNVDPYKGTNEYPSCLQACVLTYDGGWPEDSCKSYCEEDRDYDTSVLLLSHSQFCDESKGDYQFSFCGGCCSDVPSCQFGDFGDFIPGLAYTEAPYTCSTQMGTDEHTCTEGCKVGHALLTAVAPTPPPSGGDVLVHSPGLVVTGGLTLILNGFTVKDTVAKHGAAVYVDKLDFSWSNVYVEKMSFANTYATYDGGALYLARDSSIVESKVSGCGAGNRGGCVFARDHHTWLNVHGLTADAYGALESAPTETLRSLVAAAGIPTLDETTARGGLVYSTVKLRITNSELTNAGGVKGACVYVVGYGSQPSYFTNTTLKGCKGTKGKSFGGAVYAQENDLSSSEADWRSRGLHLIGCVVKDCTAHSGAGVYTARGSLWIRDGSVFEGNSAAFEGGGVTLLTGTLYIADSSFKNSAAARDGGGVSATSASLRVIDSKFEGSASLRGGAIRARDCRDATGNNAVTLTNVTVSGSSSKVSGAIHVSDVDLAMSSCKVRDNAAGSRGGGVHVDGISSSTFQNCEFTGNTAMDGGALVLAGGKASLFHTTFEANAAERNGGAVYAEATRSVEFNSATIKNNEARQGNGGGVFIAGGGRESEMNGEPTIDFRKSIVEKNVAVAGGGLAEGCDVDTTFADGVARCPRITLESSSKVRDNSASDAGGGVYYSNHALPPSFDDTSENAGNKLTGAAGYGPQRASIAAKIKIVPDAKSLSSGKVTSDTITISLVDGDGQIVSSGVLAESLVVATYPTGIAMNSGSQVRLKLGKAETPVGIIGKKQTVGIAYQAVATGDVPVPPAELRATIGSCRVGDYFDGVVCKSCGAGHYIPPDAAGRAAAGAGYDDSCFPCQGGYYSPTSNETQCEACPAGTASGFAGAESIATCVACAEDTISGVGSAACSSCGFGQMSNHGNTACVLSSSMLITIVTILVAIFVGSGALAQATFKFGNKRVFELMKLAGGGVENRAAEDAADEDAAIKSMNAILMESRVTSSASGAVELAAKNAVAAAAALTGLDAKQLASAVAPIVANERRVVETAINRTVDAGSKGGQDIVMDEAEEIAAATKDAIKKVTDAVLAECDARAVSGVESAAEAAVGANASELRARLDRANAVDHDAVDALCAAAELEAQEAIQEAAAAAKVGVGTDADRDAHTAEVKEVEKAVDVVAKNRQNAAKSREKRRGGRSLPEIASKEGNAETEELFSESFAYVAELEDAADGHLGGAMAFKPTDVATLADAKARLSATIADAAHRCRNGAEERRSSRMAQASAGEPVSDPVGVVANAGVMDAVCAQSQHSAEANLFLAVATGPAGAPDPSLAALVEYEAIADAAMATAVLSAARTIAGTYDPQGLDPFESARYAGELARVSDPMRLAIKKLSETCHEALLARLRQGASSADAANKADVEAALDDAAQSLNDELANVAGMIHSGEVDGIPPEDMSAEAYESLKDSMDALADDLQRAAAKGKDSLAARLAQRRAKGEKESRMHDTVVGEVAQAVKNGETDPDVHGAAADVLEAGLDEDQVPAPRVDVESVDQAVAPPPPGFNDQRGQLDEARAALQRQLDRSTNRHGKALQERLAKKKAKLDAGGGGAVGFFNGIRENLRQRAVAAAMVAQTEVMVAVAKEAQAVSMADEEPDEKAKEKAKELDEKLVSDMMEEHAAKLREMHAKVTDTQSAATSKLQQRLAQRKQGGKVTPAPMEGVTVDVFPK